MSETLSLADVAAEIDHAEAAAQNVEMCKSMTFALRVGHIDGKVGALDLSHVDVSEIETALRLSGELGGPRTDRAARLHCACEAIKALRWSVTRGEWRSAVDTLEAKGADIQFEETKDEIMLVRGEVRDRRLKAALRDALITSPLSGAPGSVDVTSVDAQVLADAVALTEQPGEGAEMGLSPGVVTVEARQLVATASMMRELREAIKGAPAHDWSGDVQRLIDRALAAGVVTREAQAELALAKDHAEDLMIVASLRQAMSEGGASGVVGDVQVTGVVRTHALRIAVAKADALGCKSPLSEDLSAAARVLLRVRELQIEGSWKQIEECLEAYTSAFPEEAREEVELAREEVAERSILRSARAALSQWGVDGSVGAVRLVAVKTAGLDQCVLHAEKIGGCRTEVSTCLMRAVESVREMRVCALRDDWKGVEDALGSFDMDACPEVALSEVSLLHDEVRDRNAQFALRRALSDEGEESLETAISATEDTAKSPQARLLRASCDCIASVRSALRHSDFESLRKALESCEDASKLPDTQSEYANAVIALKNYDAVAAARDALARCGSG